MGLRLFAEVGDAAELALANVAICDFIATMKEQMCRLMHVRATETHSLRVAYAVLCDRDQSPAEGEWSNRQDPPAIVKALNLSAKSLSHEFKSSGAIIGVLLNWLEELSGLPPETYLH